MNALYDRDARRYWTPTFSDVFKVAPWQMEDLTPMELDAMTARIEANAQHG